MGPTDEEAANGTKETINNAKLICHSQHTLHNRTKPAENF